MAYQEDNALLSLIWKNDHSLYQNIKQLIRMISEGSRDTENWSNGAENSALPLM